MLAIQTSFREARSSNAEKALGAKKTPWVAAYGQPKIVLKRPLLARFLPVRLADVDHRCRHTDLTCLEVLINLSSRAFSQVNTSPMIGEERQWRIILTSSLPSNYTPKQIFLKSTSSPNY